MGHNLCFISTTLERILLSEEWKSTLSVDLDKILRCHKHGNISQQKHLVGWVGPDWKDFQVRSLFSIVRFIAVRSDSRYFFDPLKPEFSQYQCSSQPLVLKDIRKASHLSTQPICEQVSGKSAQLHYFHISPPQNLTCILHWLTTKRCSSFE